MTMKLLRPSTILPLGLVTLLGLNGCAPIDIKEKLDGQKPTVSVTGKRVTHLDFERVNMAFDLQVKNPNPIGITLAGLDYDLKLAGKSFASGNQNKKMKLSAASASRIELPLSLGFNDIYQGLKKLEGKQQVPYELTTGLVIDVPLLGTLRYPVTTKGSLPLPRLPKISVKNLSLEKLSLAGASLALSLQVDNPNAFSLGLDKLNYDFSVNGKRWLSGNESALGNLKKGAKSVITLPINLNFMQMGSGLYSLLSGNKDLSYSLNGKLDASSGHKLIGDFDMPFNSDGKVRLSK